MGEWVSSTTLLKLLAKNKMMLLSGDRKNSQWWIEIIL